MNKPASSGETPRGAWSAWRDWVGGHPILHAVLVGIATGFLWLGVSLILGRNAGFAAINGIFYGLAVAAMTLFAQRRFRKTDARLDERGQALMFLRYPDARPGSLSTIWQMGIADPAPGRIDFQPAVYEDLVPTGRSKALTGIGSISAPRYAHREDNRHDVPPGFQVVSAESDGGLIEIAARPKTLQRIREAIESSAQ
ncbi:hypothetical protein QE394_001025 [Arthrobacter sp. SORGH_AS 212]|uniref:hypothetical protein n=1 Tax=Pseudarthrobacter sp. SORGH_AS 212 TaxID=3041777 RepID=UPI0027818EEB|nr:hypothetical protein [Arthrobacter sp. SORGH_AS_0212]